MTWPNLRFEAWKQVKKQGGCCWNARTAKTNRQTTHTLITRMLRKFPTDWMLEKKKLNGVQRPSNRDLNIGKNTRAPMEGWFRGVRPYKTHRLNTAVFVEVAYKTRLLNKSNVFYFFFFFFSQKLISILYLRRTAPCCNFYHILFSISNRNFFFWKNQYASKRKFSQECKNCIQIWVNQLVFNALVTMWSVFVSVFFCL